MTKENEMTPEQENILLRQRIEELEEEVTDLKSELGSAGIFL